MKSFSVTRKLLIGVVASSLVALALTFGLAFHGFKERFEAQRHSDLTLYARERARTEQQIFDDLRAKHAAATEALQLRLAHSDLTASAEEFERRFPLQPDGTRRSRPELFDGLANGAGSYMYGIGSFMARGAELTAEDKTLLLGAMRVVFSTGTADPSRFDNFYFFTPDDRMIMFAPRRADRLIYYRQDAPASFRFSGEEMAQLPRPENNPQGVMRCSRLRALLSDSRRATLTTGCFTPVYLNGRYVGAWGNSLQIGSYLLRAVNEAPAGAESLIVNGQGSLIAYPGFETPGRAEASVVQLYENNLHLTQLVQRIRQSGRRYGVLETSDGRHIISYGHVEGPDWYFLTTTSTASVVREAATAALVLVAAGALVLALQIAIVWWLVRQVVTRPLKRLAARHADGAEATDVEDIEARRDEVGGLARALSAAKARSDDLLRTLETRVQERTAELERANAAKTSFLTNMSHELRTPLNGVVALSELLKARQTEPEAREMAGLITASGRMLEQVVNDILDVSKIEAGQLKLETTPFSLRECLTRISELHRAAARAKGVELNCRISPDADGWYLGDPVRLTQILSNLLSNAVKFTERGAVTLTAKASPRGLRISVKDTGVGFDADAARRLFRRFEQADASITRKYGGTGLGLSISQSLAEMMGGDIQARSTPGKGSTFTLAVALTPTEPPQGAAMAAQPVEFAGDAPARPPRILLAEDHPTNQRVVALVLEQIGVDLTIVENGRDALDHAQASAYDLILMDVQMPEMDGLTATRAIRRFEAEVGRPRTPIVSLTANALPEHVKMSLEAGSDRHLAKPLRPDALIALVQELARPRVDLAATEAA
ncbi:ATP-binding protein [Brevundimonas sp. 2R-24]|uniref:histidine kinase n=1 Tax=Peiella sedimenti TaxID=3061083 RepID=A0ABT8SK75_9CAUL|nr:ATP-binding protein [Caulobacteraceae bacterium XZ-24]